MGKHHVMSTDPSFWNGIAETYARKPVANPEAFERKIAITRSRMSAHDVVLDIGCGTGTLALFLAPHAAHVHGLDLSREMIRIANEKARARDVDNVTFHLGPFDDTFTTFGAEGLDGICAYSILHLLGDVPSALDRIHRLLKPGGYFVSSTACLAESWLPYGPLLKALRFLGKAPFVNLLSKQVLGDEVRRAGFVDISTPDVGAESALEFMVATKPR
jgi:arsenite methyltransferase